MKKYVTFVKDEEESRKVQEALFKAGFGWQGHIKQPKHLDAHFLYIYSDNEICYDTGESFTKAVAQANQNQIMEAKHIIADPFQLDGATKPETMITIGGKEISESTIKAALQEYVK